MSSEILVVGGCFAGIGHPNMVAYLRFFERKLNIIQQIRLRASDNHTGCHLSDTRSENIAVKMTAQNGNQLSRQSGFG